MTTDAAAAKTYYHEHFPAHHVHRLCARGWTRLAAGHREFGFEELDGSFQRHVSCPTERELHTRVKRWNTGKVNIGAMYNVPPPQREKAQTFVPVGRELVFDVDLDDYQVSKDDVAACDAHWRLVALGLEVVRAVLAEEFGFEHFLLVYSGRRGGHLWILDKRAFELNNEERSSIVAFLQGGTKAGWGGRLQFRWAMSNPNLRPHAKTLRSAFVKVCANAAGDGGMGLLDTEAQRRTFLYMVHPPDHVPEQLAQDIASDSGRDFYRKMRDSCRTDAFLQERMSEAILTMIWPRLDVNVTRDTKHLLKSPFSLHPKTGRISMPVFGDAMAWRPDQDCPTALQLHHGRPRAKQALARAVLQFGAFVDRLSKSVTEVYARPILDLPKRCAEPSSTGKAKRARSGPGPGAGCGDVAAVVDLRERGASRSPRPLMTVDHPRVCWQLTRTFTAWAPEAEACDGVSNVVHVDVTTTKSTHDYAHEIPSGAFPPFRDASSQTLEQKLDVMMQAIGTAFHTPGGAWRAGSKEVIVIVDDPDVLSARDHFEALREDLGTPYTLMTVKRTWDASAWRSMLRMTIGWMLETDIDRLRLRPAPTRV